MTHALLGSGKETVERTVTYGDIKRWLSEEGNAGHIVVTYDGDVYHTNHPQPGFNFADSALAVYDYRIDFAGRDASEVAHTIYSENGTTWAE
jgi:hypothetical protein